MKRTFWTIAIGTGLLAGTVSLLAKGNTGNQLETVATGMIHQISLSGVTIRIDIQIKNPTNGKLKLRFPFIKLVHDGNTIGSSQTVDKVIEVARHGEAVAQAIMIEIPFFNILTQAPGFVKEIKSGNAVVIQVVTKSAIVLAFDKEIPYEKKENVTIKQASA